MAFLTVLFDSGKAAFVALIFWKLIPITELPFAVNDCSPEMLAGLVAGVAGVIGHNFPIYLKFKGGKGVASTIGVYFATAWIVGIASGLTWLLMAFTFRYSSLSALVALTLAPVYAYFFASPVHAFAFGLLATLSIVRHRENIKRLIKGEESKISFKKKD